MNPYGNFGFPSGTRQAPPSNTGNNKTVPAGPSAPQPIPQYASAPSSFMPPGIPPTHYYQPFSNNDFALRRESNGTMSALVRMDNNYWVQGTITDKGLQLPDWVQGDQRKNALANAEGFVSQVSSPDATKGVSTGAAAASIAKESWYTGLQATFTKEVEASHTPQGRLLASTENGMQLYVDEKGGLIMRASTGNEVRIKRGENGWEMDNPKDTAITSQDVEGMKAEFDKKLQEAKKAASEQAAGALTEDSFLKQEGQKTGHSSGGSTTGEAK